MILEYFEKYFSNIEYRYLYVKLHLFSGLKDKYKELWQDEPYFSRRQNILSRCKDFPVDKRLALVRLTYDDKHKAIMCVVPKVRLASNQSFCYNTNVKLKHGTLSELWLYL